MDRSEIARAWLEKNRGRRADVGVDVKPIPLDEWMTRSRAKHPKRWVEYDRLMKLDAEMRQPKKSAPPHPPPWSPGKKESE